MNGPADNALDRARASERVKIGFRIEDPRLGYKELLWAEREADGFRLLNRPGLVVGISKADVVATRDGGDGLEFLSVVRRGGHSTYRVMIAADASRALVDRYWSALMALGCAHEDATARLRAVDVPPGVDIYEAYGIIED